MDALNKVAQFDGVSPDDIILIDDRGTIAIPGQAKEEHIQRQRGSFIHYRYPRCGEGFHIFHTGPLRTGSLKVLFSYILYNSGALSWRRSTDVAHWLHAIGESLKQDKIGLPRIRSNVLALLKYRMIDRVKFCMSVLDKMSSLNLNEADFYRQLYSVVAERLDPNEIDFYARLYKLIKPTLGETKVVEYDFHQAPVRLGSVAVKAQVDYLLFKKAHRDEEQTRHVQSAGLLFSSGV